MKVVIFTVCRHAVAQNGLLNISDAFPSLRVPSLPHRVKFTLATRLFFSNEEEGRFAGEIRFTDPDGQLLLKSAVELAVPIFEQDATGIYIDSVGAFQTTLKTTGEFQFSITAEGQEPHVFPFYVETQ